MSGIGYEYAKALFMLASEKELREDYKEGLETVLAVFGENPQYIEFLGTFAIPLSERLEALETAFGEKIPRDVLSFLKILCEKKYISEFSECAKEYFKMCDEIGRISSAKVTSAIELTKEEKDKLSEKLEKSSGRKTVFEYVIDPSILGGLIVETDGKIMDSSLKKHLKDMKVVIKR